MQERSNTRYFQAQKEPETKVTDIIDTVYLALTEKGYDPVSQIVGYVMSGDPTYITSYNNSRFLISRMERDELIEELVRFYVSRQGQD